MIAPYKLWHLNCNDPILRGMEARLNLKDGEGTEEQNREGNGDTAATQSGQSHYEKARGQALQMVSSPKRCVIGGEQGGS